MRAVVRLVPSAALFCATLGCSDASEVVLKAKGDGDAAGPPKLELGHCAGTKTSCNGLPELTPYQAGPSVTCEEVDLGRGTIAWRHPTTGIDCPAPPCTLGFARVDPRDDGGLDVTGTLDVPRIDVGFPQSGLWLASFDAAGTLVDSTIPAFALPSRVSEARLYAPVGRDAAGNALFVVREGDLDVLTVFDFRVLRYSASDAAPTELAKVEKVHLVNAVAAPDGGFVLRVSWLNAVDIEGVPLELDIARYDASGRLLWNQPQLTRALPLTEAQVLGVDGAGNTTVLLRRAKLIDSFPTPQLADGSVVLFSVHRLARLDPEGNTLWVDDFPEDVDAQAVPTRDGGAYVARTIAKRRPDDRYVKSQTLERIDPSGRSVWVIALPGSGEWRLNTDDDDKALLQGPSPGDPKAIAFRSVSADGRRCELFEMPCLTESGCTSDEIRGGRGSLFFPIGRASRPQ
jgi:hypothetical protein